MKMMLRAATWSGVGIAALAVASCGGGGGGAAPPPAAAQGCALNTLSCDDNAHSASASAGSQGATLLSSSGSVQLAIPSNALSSTVTVSVSPQIADAPPGSLGTVLDFQPSGAIFTTPITLK